MDIDNHFSDLPDLISQLSPEEQKIADVIEDLLQPCDRKTYGEKLKRASIQLNKSVRTIQRYVKQWENNGLLGIAQNNRADKGSYRIDRRLQDFIVKTYREGNKGSQRITPKQVYLRAFAQAENWGIKPPSHMTVYRILNPIVEEKENKKRVRSPGWRGTRLAVSTRSGTDINVEYSNHVWQCDHTRADILLVDQFGELLGRPWLTTVIDTYSRCIMGIHLGFDASSSQVVALALRHAILPKSYSSDYGLHEEWGTYGKPEYFYTDGGKDFRSNHVQQIGLQLGFTCHLRSRPSEGGVVERPFKTLNTEVFSTLPGYTGSNVQERPEEAEKEACLTLKDLEKLIVRYIVDNYNQRLDARMGEQTRFQRWESGLLSIPDTISERELDICLAKQSKRRVQKGGHLQFENLIYKGEYLGGYEGETVIIRYDPRDITGILIYRRENNKEVFLTRAHAMDLEGESLSLIDAKASARRVRDAGKNLSNRSILREVEDRSRFTRKKSKKQRQKEEQERVKPFTPSPISKRETELEDESILSSSFSDDDLVEIIDYEELQEDFDF
ncbi:Mu transposase C-terminal domain-containing protein [Cyanobacterium sp. IPPAS B-1200]|uniref:Mu transposase C-terminal domain-containing protein n=1 Tax=Cyanobacterium sp. IPPAS B-1200 TaxID=1562720 RepID=UPI0008528CD8|nr:Mu transposase C-terminal domain-containing protein [Cyanobacterium sp. IPPAS B-1200]OEJ79585.1 transposase [Cyanobacterium sp. IPPAS B-1200]